MDVPLGFQWKVSENTMCKLKKELYGLKRSPRAWFGRFTQAMISKGYKQSHANPTLFIKHASTGKISILLVYVDDILVTGDDEEEKQSLGRYLSGEFEMKKLGRLKYFLGIEVAHSKHGIFISQQKYITDLLRDTGKLACKPTTTPIDPHHKLGEAKEDGMVDTEMYQRLVGELIYLFHTRPDISYAVSVLSQFLHSPRKTHLQAVYGILQYLKGSLGKGILFKRSTRLNIEAYTDKRSTRLNIEAYTDVDYAGSVVDRRSTSGYCVFIGENPVAWRSKKQNVVARSSVEAEYRAMALGVCELLWLKILLQDLKIEWEGTMRLHYDNKSAINIPHNAVQNDRTKHIEVDRYFIKEKIDSGVICTPYVPSQQQLADILTKGLRKPTFEAILSNLGMENTYSPA